jgi:hypothetical protein
MKSLGLITVAAAFAMSFGAAVLAGETRKVVPASAPRLALVIGNGDYQKLGRLDNPGRDARLIADRLRGLGFDVTEKADRDLKGMSDDIEAFARDI